MKKYILYATLCSTLLLVVVQSCRKAELPDMANYELLSGGSQTAFDQGGGAFSHEFPVLSEDKKKLHETGDIAFSSLFVAAPSPLHPGLGPVYNSNSCFSCHISDGRGKPPGANEQMVSMLFRMSIPGTDAHNGPNPAPGFGGQLQQRATVGATPEAGVNISWTLQNNTFADGSPYQLQVPTYTMVNEYCALPSGYMISPRIAPPVFGLGLLEAISDEDILSRADELDADGDGISGKANMVWDATKQQTVLGKFGWKCEAPSLLQQTAGAYNQDMGITNFVFNTESSFGQTQYDGLNDETEVSDSLLYAVVFYMRTLAVPARRDLTSPQVVRGKQIFSEAKCTSCHTPMQKTKVDVSFPELSNQTIFPYTDMLLHDMGPGLADNRPTFFATGQEWRTAPLWGIGLTDVVNGHQNFLHDGRARSLMEAVMWHEGEAQASRDHVNALSLSDRDALLAFLNSL